MALNATWVPCESIYIWLWLNLEYYVNLVGNPQNIQPVLHVKIVMYPMIAHRLLTTRFNNRRGGNPFNPTLGRSQWPTRKSCCTYNSIVIMAGLCSNPFLIPYTENTKMATVTDTGACQALVLHGAKDLRLV